MDMKLSSSSSLKRYNVIIDTRSPQEFFTAHLSGSFSFPLNEMTSRGNELPPKDSCALILIIPDDDCSSLQIEKCGIGNDDDGKNTTSAIVKRKSIAVENEKEVKREEDPPEKEGLMSVAKQNQPNKNFLLLQDVIAFLSRAAWKVEGMYSLQGFLDEKEKIANLHQWHHSVSFNLSVGRSPDDHRAWQPAPQLEQCITKIEVRLGGPGIALDLGCGSGRDVAFLAHRGWHVTAIDNRQALLKQCVSLSKRFCMQHLSCSVAPICCTVHTLLPFRAESIDLLVAVRFLHRPILPALLPLISPDGYLLYVHFVDGVQNSTIGRPKHPDQYLLHHEIEDLVLGFNNNAVRSSSTTTAIKKAEPKSNGDNDGEEEKSDGNKSEKDVAETTKKEKCTPTNNNGKECLFRFDVILSQECCLDDGRPVAVCLAQKKHKGTS